MHKERGIPGLLSVGLARCMETVLYHSDSAMISKIDTKGDTNHYDFSNDMVNY